MAFHVRDSKTDALVRELARVRGISITQAVREAAEQTLAADRAGKRAAQSLRQRLQPLFERLDSYPRTGHVADKKFFDDMWGQGEDE